MRASAFFEYVYVYNDSIPRRIQRNHKSFAVVHKNWSTCYSDIKKNNLVSKFIGFLKLV
jgi:hypothetical protein